ncbi:hypothetical protein [Streptomyces sp. NPDC002790]|uniref:hypothetical protein n=1 Tax=Streptomyces sp. NPDC002790 TaxID=3154431 RepID=UPI003330C9D6
MTPRTPRARPADHAERPVEHRLREALAAHADNVTVRTLRPARPPGPHLRRLPRLREIGRRYAVPIAGLATAAALAVGYVVLAPDVSPDRTPVPPAAPSSPTAPDNRPTPRPSSPTPSSPATPSTSAPSALPPPPSSAASESPTAKDGVRPTARPSTPE